MKKLNLTIIVPCYNVEKYVEKSIKSILEQTYESIKIIEIDDCSTDKTFSKITELQHKYSDKLQVYQNEKNKGLAYTRNRGIKLADSEFIGFIDSDDYIDNEYYEKLMTTLAKNEADIAIADMQLVDEDGNLLGTVQSGINPEETELKKAAIDNGLAASACNKVFRKTLIEKYLFLEGKINEDICSVIPAVLHAKKLAYTHEVAYYYVQRNTSIQNSTFSEKRFDIFDSVELTFDRIKDLEDFKTYQSIILYHQILMLYVFAITTLANFKDRQKYLKLFIRKEQDIRIEKQACVKRYLNTRGKWGRIYWKLVIGLLKFKSATLINLIITMGRKIVKLKKKIIDKEGKKVVQENLKLEDLMEVAKRQKRKKEAKIRVSVVVPNYNYEKFLIERIYSILNQTEKISELIILDDCSKDNSRKLIDEIVEKIKDYIPVRKVYNENNTGIAFKQWQKGFNLANGDYVWIAEADDYCQKNLLKELIKKIKKDSNIVLAYVDTSFIDKDGKVFLKSIEPEIDIRKTKHWKHSYINKGIDELNNYTFLNCTIANVSSALIKKGNYDEFFSKAVEYRQSGDWVLYAHLMTLGDVAYVNKPLNNYRVHGNNITSTMKKQKHLEEIKRIHKGMSEITSITTWHKKEFRKRYDFLIKAWNLKETKN